MKNVGIGAVIVLMIVGFAGAEELDGNNLIIEIEGFRNNTGVVLFSLYDKADGFPIDPKKAAVIFTQKIVDNKCVITVGGLANGSYAFGIVHDENENGKMDLGAFWIPQEGYAASNNAVGFIGPPSFNDAVFTLDSKAMRHQIKVLY